MPPRNYAGDRLRELAKIAFYTSTDVVLKDPPDEILARIDATSAIQIGVLIDYDVPNPKSLQFLSERTRERVLKFADDPLCFFGI
jgi:hypothetical protein